MMQRVYVTGIGAVCAIGNDVHECYRSLSMCKHGIGEVTLFDTIHTSPVGEVKLQTKPDNISRTSFLALTAATEALEDSCINRNDIESGKIRIGIISSTTVGGMDISEVIYPILFTNSKQSNTFYSGRELFDKFRQHPSDESTNYIAEKLGIKDYKATLSTACSSAANAILLGERLIREGVLDCVIAGGCDSLSKFTYNGFNSLKILSQKLCRPFDDERDGLNLGEGAGYIVLQNRNSLNRAPYCIVAGCANANDAYHQTASSENGEGDYLAMKQALEMAKLKPEDIGYINAHGTGTPNNDSSEFAAIQRLWGNNIPPFSSTKCYTGHTLAASGAIEAVFSILALSKGAIYANINCSSTQYFPERKFTEGRNLKNVLSNSFGFGGNATTIIFSKADEETNQELLQQSGVQQHCETINSIEYQIYNKTTYSNNLDIRALIPDANIRRRMSSIIKMGVATAIKCLQDYQNEQYPNMQHDKPYFTPDAIITATWLGSLADSEKFLKNIVENEETLLNPTPFIQSTFNAVGGQIALLTKNHGYNVTYTDRNNSLANAILDAKLLIKEGKAKTVLIGVTNEITPTLESIADELKPNNSEEGQRCSLPKHGAMFFILSGKQVV